MARKTFTKAAKDKVHQNQAVGGDLLLAGIYISSQFTPEILKYGEALLAQLGFFF